MAANKTVRFGPIALTTTLTTNILNPPTLTGGVNPPAGSAASYYIIKHVRIINKTSSQATCSFWLGATGANAAGTEVIAQGLSVPANSYVDWYGMLRMDTADFLVGGAGTTLSLVFQAEGEIGVN